MTKSTNSFYTEDLCNKLSYKSWAILTQSLNIAQKSYQKKSDDNSLEHFVPYDELIKTYNKETTNKKTTVLNETLNDLRNYFSHSYHKPQKMNDLFNNKNLFEQAQKIQLHALSQYEKKYDLNNKYEINDREVYFKEFLFNDAKFKLLQQFETQKEFTPMHLHFIMHLIAPLLSHQQVSLAISKLMYNFIKDRDQREIARTKYIKYYQCLSHRGIYYSISSEEQEKYYWTYEIIARLASFRVFNHDAEKEISPNEHSRKHHDRFVWGSRYIIEYLISLYPEINFQAVDYAQNKRNEDKETNKNRYLFTNKLTYNDKIKQKWHLENNSTVRFQHKSEIYSISISQLYFWVLGIFFDKKNEKEILDHIKDYNSKKRQKPRRNPVHEEEYPNKFFMRQLTGKIEENSAVYHNFWNRWNDEKKNNHDHMLYVMKNIGYFVKFNRFNQSEVNNVSGKDKEFSLNKEEFHWLQTMIDISYDHNDLQTRLKEHNHLSQKFLPKIDFLKQELSIEKLSTVKIPFLFSKNNWVNDRISWESIAKVIDKFWKDIHRSIDDIDTKKATNMAKLMGWKGSDKKDKTGTRPLEKEDETIYLSKSFIRKFLIEQANLPRAAKNSNLTTPFKADITKMNTILLTRKIVNKYITTKSEYIFNLDDYQKDCKNYNQAQRTASFYIEDTALLLLAVHYLELPRQEKEVSFNQLLDPSQKILMPLGDGYEYLVSPRANKRKINGINDKKTMMNIARYIGKSPLEYDDFHKAISQLSSESIMKIATLLKLEKDAYDKATDKSAFSNKDKKGKSKPNFKAACKAIFPNAADDVIIEIDNLRYSLFHFDLNKDNLDKIPPDASLWKNEYEKIKLGEERKRKLHKK